MKKHEDDIFGINSAVVTKANSTPNEETPVLDTADGPKKNKTKKQKIKSAPIDKQSKRKKQRITIAVIMVVVFGLATFIVYYGLNKENYYDKYYTVGETVSGKELDIVFSEVTVATSFVDFTMESGYVYVQAVYTVTNNTDEAIEWSSLPYLSLQKFTSSNKGYKYEEAEEGIFDYGALLSLSIERGFDYSDIKENLEPQASRQIADVFKISAASFNKDSYFITFDNVKAIVNIGGVYDAATNTITPSIDPPAATPNTVQ